jgi:DGQHR domain-containing protein
MKTYEYSCIINTQREGGGAPQFLLFRAKASEIYEWAAIERYTQDSKKGPQRLEKPAKVAEVKRFLEQEPRNTIPTALLVSLNVAPENIKQLVAGNTEAVSLKFQWDDEAKPPKQPGMIVDGQHRLLGVMKFQPNLMLNVVAMVNISDDETAFQFLVVNNKASRVSNNHLRALALNFQEEALSKRLMAIRMSISQHLDYVGLVDKETNSPFFGKIDWPDNQVEGQPKKGFIAPSAIESCIAYIKQKRISELEDDAILLGFFLAIWTKITTKWAAQFNSESHLREKVAIICLTQFLVNNIIYEYDNDSLDVTNYDRVTECVEKIADCISPKFWTAKWSAKSLDTASGRNMLIESLTQIRRNANAGRSWYEDVPIVDLQGDLL